MDLSKRALLVAFIVLAGSPLTPVPAKEWTLPATQCRGLWMLPLVFGDKPGQTLQFVFDTGAGSTSMDPDAVERFSGKRVDAGKKVRLPEFTIGPVTINKLSARVHDMDHLGRALGTEVDGILGFPVFRKFLLVLDYPASTLSLSDGALPPSNGTTIHDDVGEKRPFMELDIGGDKLPVLVDSGAVGGLRLRSKDSLNWMLDPIVVSASVGYDKILLNRAGRLQHDIQLGPLAVQQPVVRVTREGTRLFGHEWMHRFRWTFDQRNDRIQLEADRADPIGREPLRGFGLGFRPRDRGLEVIHVLSGAAGEQAGIRQGDMVVARNGEPIYERSCEDIEADQQGDGANLGVERGGERLDIWVPNTVVLP